MTAADYFPLKEGCEVGVVLREEETRLTDVNGRRRKRMDLTKKYTEFTFVCG